MAQVSVWLAFDAVCEECGVRFQELPLRRRGALSTIMATHADRVHGRKSLWYTLDGSEIVQLQDKEAYVMNWTGGLLVGIEGIVLGREIRGSDRA